MTAAAHPPPSTARPAADPARLPGDAAQPAAADLQRAAAAPAPLAGTAAARAGDAPTAHQLRRALGRYATGVAIVTCRAADGRPVGLTCNSFASLSLDPPLVLWSLRLQSPSLPAFDAAAHFAVNVLSDAQIELSRHFASKGVDKFAHGQWADGTCGLPLLADSAAWFECEQTHRQQAGDHALYIGRVLRLAERAVPPLVFQGGHYRALGEAL